MIWIDTDVLCVRPLPDTAYHIGREHGGNVNGAILRLPRTSSTLMTLIDCFEDPEWIPPWLSDRQQAKVAKEPPGKRLERSFRLVRSAVGPHALKHTIKAKGEAHHLRKPDVYYPVRGVYADVFFNPTGGVEGSLTPETLTVHLYASMLRSFHTNHMPPKGSFIAKCARELEFDIHL